MQWSKILSQSDAQQKMEGSLMPFRFTNENCPGNFVTWFRDEFFNNLQWNDKTWGKYQSEEAVVPINVCIQGEKLGKRDMILTHAERRNKNNNAPSTHLNFDEVTREYLQDNNMTGKKIIFTKDSTGDFSLDIEDTML